MKSCRGRTTKTAGPRLYDAISAGAARPGEGTPKMVFGSNSHRLYSFLASDTRTASDALSYNQLGKPHKPDQQGSHLPEPTKNTALRRASILILVKAVSNRSS